MSLIQRLLSSTIHHVLSHEKSILLLGPRQTGKTTLIENLIKTDLSYSFLELQTRRRFEEDPDLLIKEIKGHIRLKNLTSKPLVFIDEVQKIPQMMDVIQLAVDSKLAHFILTGSSLRKIRREKKDLNLLPGRVIELHLGGLSLLELDHKNLPDIETLLLHGLLPEVFTQQDPQMKELLLTSYVDIYLEEEIRAEAQANNLSQFSKFLTYAAVDAGKQLNIANLSREVGVSRRTLEEYYQILEDCLIVEKIDSITSTTTRRRLMKSPKYLLFDMGIRRIAAKEGVKLPQKYYGDLFEQFIGIEIIKLIKIFAPQAKCCYWRDHQGPEVDYVIEYNRQYLPFEVKWTTKPTLKDAKHLISFIKEYDCALPAYVVCQTPKPIELDENVLAINWKDLGEVTKTFLSSS